MESPRLTSKWEIVAEIILERSKDCKDSNSVAALSLLQGDGTDRVTTLAGTDAMYDLYIQLSCVPCLDFVLHLNALLIVFLILLLIL